MTWCEQLLSTSTDQGERFPRRFVQELLYEIVMTLLSETQRRPIRWNRGEVSFSRVALLGPPPYGLQPVQPARSAHPPPRQPSLIARCPFAGAPARRHAVFFRQFRLLLLGSASLNPILMFLLAIRTVASFFLLPRAGGPRHLTTSTPTPPSASPPSPRPARRLLPLRLRLRFAVASRLNVVLRDLKVVLVVADGPLGCALLPLLLRRLLQVGVAAQALQARTSDGESARLKARRRGERRETHVVVGSCPTEPAQRDLVPGKLLLVPHAQQRRVLLQFGPRQ